MPNVKFRIGDLVKFKFDDCEEICNDTEYYCDDENYRLTTDIGYNYTLQPSDSDDMSRVTKLNKNVFDLINI
jgi:hypothetical protein